MEFNFIDDGIDAVVIDNFYSDEQLELIWKELSFLTNSNIMSDDRDKLEAAVDIDGNFITNKAGVWLDNVYVKWSYSHLMRICYANLTSELVYETLTKKNPLFKIMYNLKRRTHLLSYYENTGYYSKHADAAVFTLLNYFNREPKIYTGGEITLFSQLENKKATVESRNNRVVLIPSCVMHEVSAIEMTSKKLSGEGRYCMSMFMDVATREQLIQIGERS